MSEQTEQTGQSGQDPVQEELDHSTTSPLLIVGSWTLVGIPLAYGLWQTAMDAAALLS